VYWARAEKELTELAALLDAPFACTPSYKGMVSERDPLSIGILGVGEAPFSNKICQEADVIFAVGTTFSEALTRRFGDQVIPKNARIIHVDLDPSEIGKSYPAEIGIVGDAKLTLQALIAQLKGDGQPAAGTARGDRVRREQEAWRAELAKRAVPSEGPINRWQLYGALREAVAEDAIMVGEGGTGDLLHAFVATVPIFHGGDYQPIGHGMGTSLGLKRAFPERQVVCVSGDGSFMTELQEIATAMRAGLPIVNVVVHNDAYGGMKRDQMRHYGGRVIGVDLHVPDLPKLAESFGAYGVRVERSADLVATFRDALARNRPALVDVVCPIE
jgi:acetolactate synthase-1/2/3 large subunit